MKFNTLVILSLFIFVTAKGQEYSRKDRNYKPANLQEAVAQLKIIHHDSTKQKILAMTEDEFIAGAHLGLGMWMRNNWGLWKGKELAGYFNSIGIYHPDDMSGIILSSYYRELQGQEWALDEQVQYYQDYWKKINEHFHKLKTDTAYQNKVKAQQDSLMEAQFQQKKQDWTSGKRVSGYVDHRCGFLAAFALRTQIEGTIIQWKGDKLLLYIDRYEEEHKKKRLIKCNDVRNDTILIENHMFFRLVEE